MRSKLLVTRQMYKEEDNALNDKHVVSLSS